MLLDNWLEATRFAAEAQSVIWLRWYMLAWGASRSGDEAWRMVSEKVATFSEAGVAAATAMAEGRGFEAAAERAYRPVRAAVHANNRRLVREIN